MGFTTDDLLSSAKAQAQAPSNQLTLTDADILRFASEELRSWLYPKLLDHDDTAYLKTQDYVIGSGRSYRMPKRCEANALYKVTFIDTTGYEQPLTVFEASELRTDSGCTIQGPNIVLTSGAPTSGTLRVYFNDSPNDLVATSSSQVVLAVGTNTIDVANTTGLNTAVGSLLDVAKGYSPFDLFTNLQVQSVAANGANQRITFAANIPSDIEVGDYISNAGTSPVAQVPSVLFAALCKRVNIRVQTALGDSSQLQMLIQTLDAEVEEVLDRCAPRVKAEEKVIDGRELFDGGY